MTFRFRGLALVPLTMALAMLLAPCASADAYTDELVADFNAETHVVTDPGARPPLRNVDELNRQILAGPWAWSAQPPVWVAAVAPGNSGVTTADAIHGVMSARDPKFSGVIVVIDSHGYHVRAYKVPKVIADSVDELMNQSATEHGPDPYATTSAFVSRLAGLDVPANTPVATSAVAHEKHDDWAWLKVTLVISGIALAMGGLLWIVVRRNRKHRKPIDK
ncbi:hypothetical protein A5684_00505 [Mycobacterium intracellulare]|uniref:hypothetical protein n=1 Tax=Mycobacterium intracellulare TaxID=1767 RepID=UPI0007EBE7E0|nr:hypothetical protein [Mycobacterium intracellulare]OBH68060.1 hypothetical protein A5684_00505 [Mycobacterium intracellulare]OCB08250.1 hypothetical protein A5689_08025 [Mycobacterium intracellulare subsp. yongonense]